ncbi:MAG TPA: FimV/HubP family polar landmark protein, partial [Pseudomonas sp.]|nr:FimV/HubP family polar landmark protein [Pseudomonas sp.]
MVRVRKLVLAIAAASALTSGMAQALGLGEVTLKSALNQPLVAEIELLEVRDLASDELIPTLASPEEFTKAGVDRQYFLTDLKFTPVLKPNGKSVIRITSSKPVREPYLNFLVEVLWPNGRLLREYTVLLDPPLYSPPSTLAVAPQLPVAAPRAPAAAAPRPAAPVAPAAPRQSAAAPAPAAVSPLNDKEYKTTGSDTLWEIAQRVRAGGSVHQTMLAIQDLNPGAFVDGNINRLKSGQVLRLPDEQQIKTRAQGEAVAQVAEQNNAWREGRSLAAGTRQLDATKRESAGAAPAEAPSKDSLKLVSAETGKSTAGSDKGAAGESKALSEKLAVTKESLDSTRRENDELKGRMGDLQGQ